MALNSAALNAAAVNASGAAGETLELRLTLTSVTGLGLRVALTSDTQARRLFLGVHLASTTVQRLALRLPITSDTDSQIALRLTLTAQTGAGAALSLAITSATSDGELRPGQSRQVAPWATLGGVDVSARLTGPWEVDREAGRAAVAEFTLLPTAGALDAAALIGAPVQFGYDLDGQRFVLFTGVADEPAFDPTTGLLALRCSDGLQARLDALPRPVIDALVGGYWSAALFDGAVSGYEYAQQRLSTQAADYDLDPYGIGRLHQWAAEPTPHFTFVEDPALGNFLHATLSLANSRYKDQINRIDLTVEVRFRRRVHRQRTFHWRGFNFQDYLLDSFTLPTEEVIRQAAEASGWGVTYESFERLPPSGVYYGLPWSHNPAKPPFFVTSATLGLARRWGQTVTETYQYTVTAPASIARWGEQRTDDYASLSPEPPDAQAWLDEEFAPSGGIGGTSDLAGFATAPNGDRYLDDLPAGERETAIEAALARARAQILAAHRRHSVALTAPLLPQIDLTHTARVVTPRLTAQGKVRQIIHRGTADMADRQGPQTTVVLAISLSGPEAVADSPIAAPPRPDTAPADASGPALGDGVDTHLGNRGGDGAAPVNEPPFGYKPSPPDDPSWVGWVGNYGLPIPWSAVKYDERFVVDVGEISRDPIQATRALPHTVAVPHDELILSA